MESRTLRYLHFPWIQVGKSSSRSANVYWSVLQKIMTGKEEVCPDHGGVWIDGRRCCPRQRSGADQGALQGQEADQALGKGRYTLIINWPQLWTSSIFLVQAEKSGLNSEELTALQEEFQHHQRKVSATVQLVSYYKTTQKFIDVVWQVDEYHMLLEMAGEDDGKRINDIQRELDMDVFDIRDTNEYHKKGKAIKRDYERLHRLATNQPLESPFNEPKVSKYS